MKYFLILWIIILSVSTESYAQRWKRERHHLIFGLGATGFMGDLGGADQTGTQGIRDFNFAAVKPTMIAGYRYRLMEDLSLTANLSFGYIAGDDKNTAEPFRNNRNINFRSPVIELSPQIQYYFFNRMRQGARYRQITRARGWSTYRYDAYLFAGVAGFYFNPQGYFEAANYKGSVATEELPNDGWYNLRSLKTEGQGYFPTRRNYIPVAVSIPFGIGLLVQVSDEISIGIEYGYRKTFTDYIDDVSTTYVDPAIYQEIFTSPAKIALAEYFANPTLNSLSENVTAPGQQRGNPYNTDAYMFSFITLYYKIPEQRRPYGVPRF